MRRAGRLVVICLVVAGCWSDEGLGERPLAPVKGPDKSLYERLKKEEGIRRIVDEWLARSISNPYVNFTRKGTSREWTASDANAARLKAKMVELLCERTGGPQKYQGRDAKSVHLGMQISGGEFDAMKRDLKETLKMLKVKEKEQNELLKVIESGRKDMVEVP